MERLKNHRKIAFDLDGTLVDGVASDAIAEFIRQNPDKIYFIVTFRRSEELDTLEQELQQVGLERADFAQCVPLPRSLAIEYDHDCRQRLFSQLPPPKTVDHMLPGEYRHAHWKGFICSKLGATVLIDDMPEMSAPGCKQFKISLEHPKGFMEELVTESFDDDDTPSKAILRDIASRVDQQKLLKWAVANGWTAAEIEAGDYDLPNVLENWLESEHSITVSDGLVSFWQLYGDVRYLIGDNPVALYHFTSSARVPSIRKHGLVAGKRSVNRTTNPGVYLTTEGSGPAIRGYLHNALRGTRVAHGVCITVRTFLRDISPDLDDEDIQSGRTQFVTDHIAPEQIVDISRA